MSDVIVVGGGVVGLTTAVVLAERGERVRVWTRDPERWGVSPVAGALCWPYRIEPGEQALDWAVRSFHDFAGLAERSGVTGVRMVPGTMEGGWLPPAWAALVGEGPECTTPLIDMPAYLHYLRDRLASAGGGYEQRDLASLDEAGEHAPTVVNCAGLGARELVPDPELRPVQGQLVIVANPGIDRWYVAADPGSADTTYVLPQPFGVVLGGTAREGAEGRDPDPATAKAIVERCARVHPALAGARITGHRVGLRPYRPGVRLAAERLPGGALCVHHYGHGGAGVTVSWGCARDAAHLVPVSRS